jgi:hypothetical protein
MCLTDSHVICQPFLAVAFSGQQASGVCIGGQHNQGLGLSDKNVALHGQALGLDDESGSLHLQGPFG